MSNYEYKSWEPLTEIAAMAECPVSIRQLREWERKREKNGFPEPKEEFARYRFYDPDELFRWMYLYMKATKHLGRGREINNGKR